MDEDEIILYNGKETPSSYDTIQKYIKESNESDSLDKISNWIDKVPPIFKVIAKHIDPTGIISDIDDFLKDHKSQREQKRLILSISILYDVILKHEAEVRQAMITLKDDFQALTQEYFIRCKESRQLEKLLVFRDIWYNSIKEDSPFSEKEYVFSLISELTIDQINVLKYIYQKCENEIKEKGRKNTSPKGVKAYSDENGLAYEYVQQICINLSGKGLLVQGVASFIQSEPTHFLPSSYMDKLIEFLKSCE